MTPVTSYLITAALFLLLTIGSVACYSLRRFSRTELDELCEERGQGNRFIDIVQNWESALVAIESGVLICWLACVACSVGQWDLLVLRSPPPEGFSDWFDLVMRWLVLLVSLLLFGVVVPRSIARVGGARFLFRSWPLIQTGMIILRPAISIGRVFDVFFYRLFGIDEPDPNDPNALMDEIRTVVDAGERMGAISRNTGSMIDHVMDLKDADVASVMTPRTEMCFVRADMSMAEARESVLEARHTRMPVVGETTDDIIGILYAKDLLRYVECPEEQIPSIPDICREAMYIPETTSVDHLLETMNRNRMHMAIVLDEYGGVAGLVTMEDLLEEIVGEIVDEDDEFEVDPIRRVSSRINEVDARVHIDDLVEEFDYELPEERDYDTIGGFVFSHLGRIPENGETFEFGNLRFTVLNADDRRVLKLRIELDESLSPVGHDE